MVNEETATRIMAGRNDRWIPGGAFPYSAAVTNQWSYVMMATPAASAVLPAPWHRTKMICTVGPATDAPGVLEALIGAGMDVARLNMSHGEHADHARRIAQVREAARRAGQPVAILADLPGPKFRVGQLPDGARDLPRGAQVALAATGDDPADLPVRHREVLDALRPGEAVYLADGSIQLKVRTTAPDRVVCEVIAGGTVRGGSGINLPESHLAAVVPTDADRRHMAFAAAQQVEWIGVSFVQTAGDLARVRAHLPPEARPLLMAKIEKPQALAALDAILAAADGVMVARGDLGVETDLAEIPLVQKRIIARANAKGIPVVTATQMLESMVEREQPTRAEVTDVANALLDGTDAVMLSGETAIGRHPIAAANILRRVLSATEGEYAAHQAHERLEAQGPGPSADAIGLVACQLAARLNARAILAPVRDMNEALELAQFRPQAPVLALTPCERLCRQLAMVRGVAPLTVSTSAGPADLHAVARNWLFAHGLAQPGDPAVVISASGARTDQADTLQVLHL